MADAFVAQVRGCPIDALGESTVPRAVVYTAVLVHIWFGHPSVSPAMRLSSARGAFSGWIVLGHWLNAVRRRIPIAADVFADYCPRSAIPRILGIFDKITPKLLMGRQFL